MYTAEVEIVVRRLIFATCIFMAVAGFAIQTHDQGLQSAFAYLGAAFAWGVLVYFVVKRLRASNKTFLSPASS